MKAHWDRELRKRCLPCIVTFTRIEIHHHIHTNFIKLSCASADLHLS